MIYIAGAVLFVCIAHLIRIFRWELFIEVYERPNRKKLMQSIACGYLLNYFLPCKLGEIPRAWWAGRSMKNGMALGFSTVIIERYLDIVFVGILFTLMVLGGVVRMAGQRCCMWRSRSSCWCLRGWCIRCGILQSGQSKRLLEFLMSI